jgi:hypothetical protein
MIKFVDGPADGKTLMLRRCPGLLRVVKSGVDEWDALDQLTDTPQSEEQIFIYRRLDDPPPSKFHLYGGRKGTTGWYVSASYSLLEEQPADEDMRTNERWQRWATNWAERQQ